MEISRHKLASNTWLYHPNNFDSVLCEIVFHIATVNITCITFR